MAELREQFERIREIRCAAIDETTLSPQNRAAKVLKQLQKDGELDSWDGICFAALFLTSQLLVIPDLEKDVKAIGMKLMQAHYFNGGEFGLYDEESIRRITKQRFELTELQRTISNPPESSGVEGV